jgi:hypothetical protein
VTIGAYKVLEKLGIIKKIKQFAGSSSGSILATLAAIHMSSAQMEEEFLNLDMDSLKDDSFGIFTDISRLLDNYGFYKGDALEEWIEGILCKYTGTKNITFSQVLEIYGSTLYITRVNLSELKTEYLSVFVCPNMKVSSAIRHSTSIPFVFKTPRTSDGDIIIDGSVGDGYPLDLFDTGKSYNKKTLGLKIMSPLLERRDGMIRNKIGYDINNIVGFIEAFLIFQMALIERLKIKPGYWERTITLDSPDRSIQDFNLSRADKIKDIKKGMVNTVAAMGKYIDTGHF